jgi:GNAT superfamily N-acetyltransferase
LGGFRENSLENYPNCAAGIFIYTMRFSNQLPPMSVDVSLATAAERTPLFRMLELYQHDLSDIWDQDVDAAGEFGYGLDRYWSEAGNWPYVFRVNNHFAGFALVDTRVKLPNGDFWMDQFFVMKKYRGRGVGKWGKCRTTTPRVRFGATRLVRTPTQILKSTRSRKVGGKAACNASARPRANHSPSPNNHQYLRRRIGHFVAESR